MSYSLDQLFVFFFFLKEIFFKTKIFLRKDDEDDDEEEYEKYNNYYWVSHSRQVNGTLKKNGFTVLLSFLYLSYIFLYLFLKR